MSQQSGDSKSEQSAADTGVEPVDQRTSVLPATEVATRVLHAPDDSAPAQAEAVTRIAPDDSQLAAADPAAPTRVLKHTEASTPAAEPSGGSPDPEDLATGTVIKNRFIVEGVLGRGGMGVVYRVRDLRKEETRDRDPYLAMKVLNDRFRREPRMVMAMQREARKAQALAHPNISTVYDFDRDDQLVFLTMELLQGDSLDEVIRKNPRGMPRARALEIIRGLCLGLAYAHNKNIIHSDFKPGNVFLTADGRTKILDFGIARAAPVSLQDSSSDSSSDATHFDAATLGALTPAYASCEMLEGSAPHPADDVFALAIVCYQLLTGRHPFDRLHAVKAREQGLTPSPVPGVRRREWRALQHGLAFNRSDRSDHAASFLRELEGSQRLRLTLATVASALVITSGYLIYDESRKMIANRPDIAFTALSGDVQRQFRARLTEGRMLESFDDYSSALQQYKAAYQLHPKNPQAVAALESFFTTLYDLSQRDPKASQMAVLQENLAEVRRLDGYLANRPKLKSLAEKIDAIR